MKGEIPKRMNSFSEKSPEILKPILEGCFNGTEFRNNLLY